MAAPLGLVHSGGNTSQKATIALYGLTIALFFPAVLTNYLGVCPAAAAPGLGCWFDAWDFYESTFMFVALLDFIPFFATVELLEGGGFWYRLMFMVTGTWMIIMAIPDIFLSYVPWALNLDTWLWYYSDYHAYWFGSVSLSLLFLNLFLFVRILLRPYVARRTAAQARPP